MQKQRPRHKPSRTRGHFGSPPLRPEHDIVIPESDPRNAAYRAAAAEAIILSDEETAARVRELKRALR
jgi:hypothetical protein